MAEHSCTLLVPALSSTVTLPLGGTRVTDVLELTLTELPARSRSSVRAVSPSVLASTVAHVSPALTVSSATAPTSTRSSCSSWLVAGAGPVAHVSESAIAGVGPLTTAV